MAGDLIYVLRVNVSGLYQSREGFGFTIDGGARTWE
jgi:hypothetical protein